MQESSLHAALKNLYTREGDRQEVAVDGYFIDVVSGDVLIEIQTGNFTHLRPKLVNLLDRHPVLVIYPIAVEKWIVRLPAQGDTPIDRRKSPRRGRMEYVFRELVRIPEMIAHPNFALEVLLTREEEFRRDDGRGSWRRKGWSIADRRLLDVVDRMRLRAPRDFQVFLPETLDQPFTARQLGRSLSLPGYLAGKAAYCLRQMGLIEQTGKRGRAYLYNRCSINLSKDLEKDDVGES